MAEVEIADVLAEAQAALEANRPLEAIAACQHARQHFPDSITTLRLLGEAYLEVGRPDDASKAFEAVLRSDPFNVLARIGLAVIAEERGEDERALMQFRLAWEVDPLLPQLRGELVRLYRKRYGPGGHLRMTRPALAMLHTRNLDFVRAIKEYRLLVQEQPERPDLALGLSEVLWRRGDDWQARVLCERLLTSNPRLARVLYILADIIAAQGGDPRAYLATARQVDPSAEIARTLHAARPSTVLAAYLSESIRVRAFDPSSSPAWDAPVEAATPDGDSTAPLTWESIAASWSDELAPTTGEPGPDAGDQGAALFPDLERERTGEASARREDTATVRPFSWSPGPAARPEAGGHEAASEQAPANLPVDAMRPEPDEPDAVARLTVDWEQIDAELEAATPPRQPDGAAPAAPNAPDNAATVPFRLDQFAAPTAEHGAADALPTHEAQPAFDAAAVAGGPEPFRPEGVRVHRGTGTASFSELLRQGNTPATPPDSPATSASASAPSAAAGESATPKDHVELAGEPPAPQPSSAGPDGENQAARVNPSGTGDVEIHDDGATAGASQVLEQPRLEPSDEPLESQPKGTRAEHAEPAPEPSTHDELYGSLPPSYSDATDQIPVHAEPDELPSWLRGDLFADTVSSESKSPVPAAGPGPEDEPARPETTTRAEQPDAQLMPPDTAAALDSPQDVRDADHAATGQLPALPSEPTLSEGPPARAPEEPLIGVAPMSTWRADWNAPEPEPAPTTGEPRGAEGAPGVGPESARTGYGAPAASVVEGAAAPGAAASWTAPVPDEPSAAPRLASPGGLEAHAASDALPGTVGVVSQETRHEAPDGQPESAVAGSRDERPDPKLSASPEEALATYRLRVKESETVPPEVVVALREMIAAGTGGPRAHRVLGEAYLKLGQYDLASAELQQALRARFPR